MSRLKAVVVVVALVGLELHRERVVATEHRLQQTIEGVNAAIDHINQRFEVVIAKLQNLEELNDYHWGHSPEICRVYQKSLQAHPPKMPANILEHPQNFYPPEPVSPPDTSSVRGVLP